MRDVEERGLPVIVNSDYADCLLSYFRAKVSTTFAQIRNYFDNVMIGCGYEKLRLT